jgi:LacI family transcriptional regulator
MPEDLSVIAYDDLPLADYLDPPLTTIAMPLLELGAAAVTAVLDQLGGQVPRDIRLDSVPAVIERRSTGPAPERGATHRRGGAEA